MKKLKHVYSNCNQYAERDIEQLGDYYMVHVDAMTVESLHSKSGIAAELAFRDQRIAELEKELSSLVRGIKDLGSISYDQFPDTKTAESLLKEQGK